jgi:putative protease
MIEGVGLVPVADQRMNVANRYTKAQLSSRGINSFILSAELTLPMARDIGGALTVLGRLPLMITERCFVKENFGCKKCMHAELVDRMGKRFPILREWRHRNIIFNSVPTYMGDKKAELRAAGIRAEHFIFSSESAEEVVRMLSAHKRGDELARQVCRIRKKRD